MYNQIYDDIYVKALQYDSKAGREFVKLLFDLKDDEEIVKYNPLPRKSLLGDSVVENDIILGDAIALVHDRVTGDVLIEVQTVGSLEDIAWRIMQYAYAQRKVKKGYSSGVMPQAGIMMLRYRNKNDDRLLGDSNEYVISACNYKGKPVLAFDMTVKFLSTECKDTIFGPLALLFSEDGFNALDYSVAVADSVKKFVKDEEEYVAYRFLELLKNKRNPTEEDIDMYNRIVTNRYSFDNPYIKIHEEVERECSSKIAEYSSKLEECEAELQETREEVEKVRLETREEVNKEREMELEDGISNIVEYFGCSKEMAFQIFKGNITSKSTVSKMDLAGNKGVKSSVGKMDLTGGAKVNK